MSPQLGANWSVRLRVHFGLMLSSYFFHLQHCLDSVEAESICHAFTRFHVAFAVFLSILLDFSVQASEYGQRRLFGTKEIASLPRASFFFSGPDAIT